MVYRDSGLTQSDFIEVARLHCHGLPQGFLSTLGEKFLSAFYQLIAESELGVVILAIAEGRVVGFVSGATCPRSITQTLWKERGLMVALLWNVIFSPKKIGRLIESRRYALRDHPGLRECPAELLSLVVEESFRGKGVGRELFRRLRAWMRDKGVDRFKIMVGSALVGAQSFYEKNGAIKQSQTEVHRGEQSFLYYVQTAS